MPPIAYVARNAATRARVAAPGGRGTRLPSLSARNRAARTPCEQEWCKQPLGLVASAPLPSCGRWELPSPGALRGVAKGGVAAQRPVPSALSRMAICRKLCMRLHHVWCEFLTAPHDLRCQSPPTLRRAARRTLKSASVVATQGSAVALPGARAVVPRLARLGKTSCATAPPSSAFCRWPPGAPTIPSAESGDVECRGMAV